MVFYLISLIVVALDQLTKYIVIKSMELHETIPIIEGVFHFTSHRNRGAAFGILQEARWFFIIITVIVVAAIIRYLPKMKGQPLLQFSLSLVLGGAIGNFIDRLRMGEVVDFLDFRLINFPIFNIADSAIVVGVAILLLGTLFESRKTKQQEQMILKDE